MLLKLQLAPQILQPKGRVCLHVLHVLHALHHLLMPIADQALHDLEVPSLLAVKTRKTRAKSRVKEVVNAIAMLLHLHGLQEDACGKTQQKDTKRSKDLLPEYSAVLGSHVSHARS